MWVPSIHKNTVAPANNCPTNVLWLHERHHNPFQFFIASNICYSHSFLRDGDTLWMILGFLVLVGIVTAKNWKKKKKWACFTVFPRGNSKKKFTTYVLFCVTETHHELLWLFSFSYKKNLQKKNKEETEMSRILGLKTENWKKR